MFSLVVTCLWTPRMKSAECAPAAANLVPTYPSHDTQLFGRAFVCFLGVLFKDEICMNYLSAC